MVDPLPPSERPLPGHVRPAGLDDASVAALGRLSEALETVERARGRLYDFHQLTGQADLALGEAATMLRSAGQAALADQLETELVGRNVVSGRWTFQLVEDYDDGYWSTFRSLERQAREQLAGGRRHLQEAEMKEARRTSGLAGHEARPAEGR